MSQRSIPSIASLPASWKRLMRRCHDLWFGELSDCQVQQGSIIKVERFVKSVFTKPASPTPAFNESKPIPNTWQIVMAICERDAVRTIPTIKIEAGEPVRVCIDEGGWTTDLQ
ncbi:MAG: hypothetical protein KCHDKBKB_01693 [Elusimicrobia bacterium]|nr:hypothetical protein [Elusimicrobiota bacterium]